VVFVVDTVVLIRVVCFYRAKCFITLPHSSLIREQKPHWDHARPQKKDASSLRSYKHVTSSRVLFFTGYNCLV